MFKTLTAGVRAQLRLAFAIVIAISLLSTGLSIYRLGQLAQNTKDITTLPLAKERTISKWLVNTSTATKRVAAVARSVDPDLAAYFAKETKSSTEVSAQLQAQVKALLSTDEEKSMFATIGTLRQRYLDEREAITKLKASGQNDAAREMFDETFNVHTLDYVDHLKQLLEMQQRAIDSQAKQIGADADRAKVTLSVVCAIMVAVSITSAALFSRSLFRRLGGEPAAAAAIVAEIARVNLTVPIALSRGDAHSLLAHMKLMRDSLSKMVGEVRTSTAAIRQSAESIANEAQDLSGRTERQAASLEETASSMEELTQTVSLNAENAQQASALSADATRIARQGGEMVDQLVSTMGSISDSSQRVADIIGVIDGIAFQTNILALNAAVEAARVGEQGKGFAVVASEVCALAQRSAAAAKEIKGLIEDSNQRVELGAGLVQKSGKTMVDIVAGIERDATLMGDIVVSSREQASGIAQIADSVSQMDQATQQNAGMVEETAQTASSLQIETGRVHDLVAVFRIDANVNATSAQHAAGKRSTPRRVLAIGA